MQLDFHFLNGGKFISRGAGIHPNRTISSAELILVLSGHLGIRQGSERFFLGPGEFLLLKPEIRHAGTVQYPANLSFFWGHFTGSPSLLAEYPTSGTAVRPERFAAYFEELLTEQHEPDHEQTCDLLLAQLLLEIQRPPLAAGDPENQAGTVLAETAMRLLKLHFTEDFSTAAAAKMLGCNPDYLGRVFRARFGDSLIETLNRLRLAKSAAMLENSSLSIKEILFASGFRDPAYFRRRFFREYAVTPAKYRKLHASLHINTE